MYIRAGDTEGPEDIASPHFCIAKRKNCHKGKKKKKESDKIDTKEKKKKKSLKTETIKRLSPRTKCYCFSHSRASKTQFFFLSVIHVC